MYAPMLIESGRPLASRGAVEGGMVSFVVHSTLVAAAVYGTMAATKAVVENRLIVDVSLPREEAAPPPPPAQPVFGAPPLAFNRLEIPAAILTEIPPPSRAPFDPTSIAGDGVEAAAAWGRTPVVAARAAPAPDSIYLAELVEERPVRTGGQPPVYPVLLRNAGIEGEVDVGFVVDTMGRVEARSGLVLRSTNRYFDQPALDAAATWVFRPAQVGGHPVRARVHLVVTFKK
jgi:TonB family protein